MGLCHCRQEYICKHDLWRTKSQNELSNRPSCQSINLFQNFCYHSNSSWIKEM